MQTDIMMCDLIWPKSLGIGVCILTWTCAPLSLWILSHLHRLKARRMLGEEAAAKWRELARLHLSISIRLFCNEELFFNLGSPQQVGFLGPLGPRQKVWTIFGIRRTWEISIHRHRVLRHESPTVFRAAKPAAGRWRCGSVDKELRKLSLKLHGIQTKFPNSHVHGLHTRDNVGVTCPTETPRILKLFDRS